jgi:predicted lipoprotein with Yx(FWY)xxD motif
MLMSTVRERGAARTGAAAGLAVLVTAVVACGGPAGAAGKAPASRGSRVTIEARSLPGVGTVLVSSRGYALYMFEPDAQRQVTCTGLCAATWPPVRIPASASLAAGRGVSPALLGSDRDPAGGSRVVTYNGWPLYAYTGDVAPGQVTGQGIDLNGGDWYLIRPSGQPVTTGPA